MALLAGTALIAAACGDDDDGGAADTTGAPTEETQAPGTTAGARRPRRANRPAMRR